MVRGEGVEAFREDQSKEAESLKILVLSRDGVLMLGNWERRRKRGRKRLGAT